MIKIVFLIFKRFQSNFYSSDIQYGPACGSSLTLIIYSCKYEPLPTIVDAARRIMNEEELPNIRKVNSTCIPQALESLNKLTEYAKENKKHAIAFVYE